MSHEVSPEPGSPGSKPDSHHTIRVRPVALDDYAQWLPLWTGYNAFYERVLPDAITRTTWARFFDPDEPVHALVAERVGALVAQRDGALLGIVHYLFHRSTSMIEPTCYLQDLFTEQALRGRGVGRALIEAVYARAKAVGAARVYWQTHETNTTAQLLYDRIADRTGFIVYRRQL